MLLWRLHKLDDHFVQLIGSAHHHAIPIHELENERHAAHVSFERACDQHLENRLLMRDLSLHAFFGDGKRGIQHLLQDASATLRLSRSARRIAGLARPKTLCLGGLAVADLIISFAEAWGFPNHDAVPLASAPRSRATSA